MKEEFLSKYKNNEYISNFLYQYIKENESSIIPSGFDIDKYNETILDKLYKDNKQYFEDMYKGIDDNIHLDEEQCKAILADEKYSLIIAGAGTGKTTTMVSKVKYLVDKKKADPERILVMSYTRKATEEIALRIEENFELPVHVTTFHSLGYEYLKALYPNQKLAILDRNKISEIYYNYFSKLFEDKNKIEEISNHFQFLKKPNSFLFSQYFMDNYKKYKTYEEYIDAYVNYKIDDAKRNNNLKYFIDQWVERQLVKDYHITSIKGEYVKSAGELVIANFLYTHGLDYSYEEVYDEIFENGTIYKPDFTIDYAGQKIYIEYFGLDDKNYNRIRTWKENFHRRNGNKFIEINRLPLDKIVESLDQQLTSLRVSYNDRSNEEIYEQILRLNPISTVYPFLYFLRACVVNRKESLYRTDLQRAKDYVNQYMLEDRESIEVQYKYIMDFEKYYNEVTSKGPLIWLDFADLLYYSVKQLEKLTTDTKLKFDYIIIDEYQDISQLKYELTYKTAARSNACVYAVGDDWQSIYAFSGSRIEYIYNFSKFFKGSHSFKISKTYRNSQELIDASGTFIMKNPDQIRKHLVSDKHLNTPVVYVPFDDKYDKMNEIKCLKETILNIHRRNPDHRILVLGRTNNIVDSVLLDPDFVDDIGSKITIRGNEDIEIDNMTMHKSKGLTYDDVIIIGLDEKFPRYSGSHWYIGLYKNKPIYENIPFAEERRLFYVALTRTKNRVYLLVNKDPQHRSPFIKELHEIMTDENEQS